MYRNIFTLGLRDVLTEYKIRCLEITVQTIFPKEYAVIQDMSESRGEVDGPGHIDSIHLIIGVIGNVRAGESHIIMRDTTFFNVCKRSRPTRNNYCQYNLLVRTVIVNIVTYVIV